MTGDKSISRVWPEIRSSYKYRFVLLYFWQWQRDTLMDFRIFLVMSFHFLLISFRSVFNATKNILMNQMHSSNVLTNIIVRYIEEVFIWFCKELSIIYGSFKTKDNPYIQIRIVRIYNFLVVAHENPFSRFLLINSCYHSNVFQFGYNRLWWSQNNSFFYSYQLYQ